MKYLMLQGNPVATNIGLKRDIMDMFPNVEKIVSSMKYFRQEIIIVFVDRIRFVFEPRLPKPVLQSHPKQISTQLHPSKLPIQTMSTKQQTLILMCANLKNIKIQSKIRGIN